jgi:hypothetical protein
MSGHCWHLEPDADLHVDTGANDLAPLGSVPKSVDPK